MSKKSTAISLIIFGLLFGALGAFLFLAQSGAPVVIIIAILDIVFGVLLIFGGLKAKDAADEIEDEDNWQYNEPAPQQPQMYEEPARERRFSSRSAAHVADPDPFEDDLSMDISDPSELASREGELRAASQRAAEEATKAKKIATKAIKDAKKAEDELDRAEEQLMQMSPAEQRSAMRHIDNLAQIAAEKSEIATKASQRARVAIQKAKDAAELHSRAMDAAADAMSGDDEFADFN